MKLMHLLFSGILLSVTNAAVSETFTALEPTTCPTSSTGLFTTGQQYMEAGNGVLPDSWSMLVRWQGIPTVGNTQWISSPLTYNAGIYTDYTPPTPYSTWQRGYQPESQLAATPGVQLHCFDAGMVINTWYTPHSGADVLGGGFNDMYGYAWSPARQPYAFKHLYLGSYLPNELVLQASLAVTALNGFTGTLQANGTYAWAPVSNVNADPVSFGSGQLDLFVYLRDTSHPLLHPIAVIAGVYGNGAPYTCETTGRLNWDYAQGSSKQGIWFAATGFCNTDISTIRYTGGYTTNVVSATPTFYRIHYTPQNWNNLVNRINNLQCQAGVINSCKDNTGLTCMPGNTCPQIGYSTDPNVYTVQYEGTIAEVKLCDHTAGCGTNIPDSQVGMAVYAHGPAAFSYTAN